MKVKNCQVSQNVVITTIASKSNRCTIGYRKVNRMVQVAVSYCAPDDKWNKHKGRMIVVDRLEKARELHYMCGVISLPMGKYTDLDIQSILIDMFGGFDID